jgi:thioredoxin 1
MGSTGSQKRRKFMVPIAVSDDTFEAEVLKASQPVLVDFWAEWFGPCRMIAPALEEIAKELGDKVKIVKMNVDENPHTPGAFGIRGIPTLLMFKNGRVAAQKVGAQPKGQLKAWITEAAEVQVA